MTTTLPFGGFLDIETELLIRNLSLLVFDHEFLCWFENMTSLGTFLLRSCQKSRPQEQGHRDWKPPMEAQPFLLFSSTKPVLMLTLQRWEEMRFGVDRGLNGQRPWPSAEGAARVCFLALFSTCVTISVRVQPFV